MKSEAYLGLRSERTRYCSLALLNFLLEEGGRYIRRAEIRNKFVLGVRKKEPKTNDPYTPWKSPFLPLTDREMQLILDRLVEYNIIETLSYKPHSNRTKRRKKRDRYYYVLLKRVIWNDIENNPEWMAYFNDPYKKLEMINQVLGNLKDSQKGPQDLDEKIKFISLFLLICEKNRPLQEREDLVLRAKVFDINLQYL